MTDQSKRNKRNRDRGKDLERYVADFFGGERIGLLGKDDVRTADFSIECKEREKLPKSILSWVKQAEDNCQPDKTPVVYLHQLNDDHVNDLVIINATAFISIYGKRI